MSDSLLHALFVAVSVAYATASIAYFIFIGNGAAQASAWAGRILRVAALVHAGFLIGDLDRHAELGDVRQMLAAASLTIICGHLIALHYAQLAVLGAFVTPIALLMFLASGLGHSVPEVPEHVRSALLPAHVAVNVLGITALTLAFAVSTAYLIQERLLRRRQLRGLFKRLPPLDVLDALGLRLSLVGFPLFTIGTISGAFWAAKTDGSLSPTQVMGLVAWAVFGTVLLLRVAAGWQGRRAAIGTLLGFACAATVLAGYALRASTGAL